MPVTLTWTGHATFLIDTGAGTILVDPFFDECPTASMKAADVACDLILLTHGHSAAASRSPPGWARRGSPISSR
jgi:L-ascorbate metabolism protein UlaG (beta-lactamase superfamily)